MVKVSVVMPAYNAEKYIAEAIESILNQTYTNFEFIIIDDGSSDNTANIIKSFQDSRIVYLKNEQNMGIVYSLNKGIEMSKGDYIARMDADDISLPNRLQRQVEYMDNYLDVGLLGSSLEMFENDKVLSILNFSKDSNQLKADLLFNSCLAHPTVMIRKALLSDFSLKYDNNYLGREDFKLWWEISKISNIFSIDEVLLKYRIHGKQVTKNYSRHDLEKEKNFLKERLQYLMVDFKEEELDIMFKYTRNKFDELDFYEIKKLLVLYHRIIMKTKSSNLLEINCLKKVCALSVNYMMLNVKLTKMQKINIFAKANKLQIYNLSMLLKSFRILLK